MRTVGRRPRAPLIAVNRAKISASVRPFIPNRHAVFRQVPDIGIAFQKPKQLVNDRAQVQFLGREQRKALFEVEAHLLNLPPQLFWNQWKAGNIERTVIDEKKRKVKFRLKIGRQNILNNKEPEPVGIRNPERGRVSDVEESIHENSECTKKKKQADSTVLFVKSEV